MMNHLVGMDDKDLKVLCAFQSSGKKDTLESK